jgi:hypothetical protein
MAQHNLIVEPGSKVFVKIAFASDLRHVIRISEFTTGALIEEFDNETANTEWESPLNESAQVMLYVIDAQVMAQFGDRFRLVPTESSVDFEVERSDRIRFGFDEGNEKSFAELTATVVYHKAVKE